MSPYRTNAPPSQPKEKYRFKMAWPNIKLGKAAKAFSHLMPTVGTAVGIGFLYDTSIVGQGMKVGLGFGMGFIAVFFLALMFITLDTKHGY